MTTEISTLANGLRVVSEDMPQLETASIGVWVDVGARYENADINGVSHLLEHMAFKGTKRRSALAIAEEIEAVGGHVNAYTSREQTAYYAKVMKEDVALAVDILADILQHSTFAEEELERERAVVVQEIAQAHDTPDDVVFDQFQEIVYPDQPLGRTILGPAAQVENYSRAVLADYMARHYRAERMVVVGAGRIEHEALVELAGNAFDTLSNANSSNGLTAKYEGGDGRASRELEQVHLVLGFDGIAYGDPDFYTLQLLSTLLGGGMSSRLFQEIRERRGLAYAIFTFASSYTDGGVFGIYCGTGPDNLSELTPVIADEILKVCDEVAAQEVARARAQLKSGLLMSLESSSSRCERLGRHMLIFNRPIPIEEMVAEIDAITAEDVVRVAARILRGSRPSLAALGPVGNLENYDRLAERFV
ncbi:MAG TPA: pitrilysin family protein [Alphaproteobacteria bacterium]|nr:pitrilysin family protein [Alphaproteobacteria bacterium]